MLDWLFRNRQTGKITIAQAPNLSLWVFIVATVLRWIVRPSGTPGTALDVLTTGALALWAIDEVVRGVNPWRRALGVGALAWQLAPLLDR